MMGSGGGRGEVDPGCKHTLLRSYTTGIRVDLNEGCFLGLFQYLHEISVFLGFFL